MSWDEWSKRRRRFFDFPFRLFGYEFENFDTMIEEMFKEVRENIPKELIKEEKLPRGDIIRRIGPIVFGYSMTTGPDGKPIIREFGNIKPFKEGTLKPEVKAEIEPLVDIFDEANTVKVVAEVPGVEKENIKMECDGKSLTIKVDAVKRKYYKVLDLPTEVETDSAKASYRNGVLEVTLNKTQKSEGYRITIE